MLKFTDRLKFMLYWKILLHIISVEGSLEDLTHWSTDPDLTEGIRVSVQQTFHQSSRPLDLRFKIGCHRTA